MRQRKPKDLEKRIDECGEFLVKSPGPGAWRDCFGTGKFFVEIGCGKGDFIIAKAMDDPANNYLGIEGQESVLLRALEKATWLAGSMSPAGNTDARTTSDTDTLATGAQVRPLGNLRFTGVYVRSMKDLFDEGSLDGIYLNFSDPWPKKRHYKRRLTWRGRLMEYAWALRAGGAIEIKTDNDDLFDFTLEEVEALGWVPDIMTRDLHSTDLEARLTMTEYEKKFHNAGKSINYLRVIP